MDCSLQEWWCLTLLVLFPLGPPSGWRAGMGRRLPVNIWTWAGSRAGVERSQGSQAGEVSAPPDTGLGRLSMCSPPPSQNKTMVKTRTDAQEGGYCGHFRHLGQGPASNREACGSSSHKSLELRERTGEPRTEKEKGKSSQGGGYGQAESVVLLPPSSSGAGGSRVGGGPSCQAPLPLRRGRSPSGCS